MILKTFMMSLFCFGMYTAMQPGMLLNPIKEKLRGMPSYLFKPLFACIYCMASTWGTLAYILISIYCKDFNIAEYVVCVVSCIALNKWLYILIEVE